MKIVNFSGKQGSKGVTKGGGEHLWRERVSTMDNILKK